MRSHVPIYITNAMTMNACYVGGLNPRILVALDASRILTQAELQAVVDHEMGHRLFWHTEINFALTVSIFSSTGWLLAQDWVAAAWTFLGLMLAHGVLRVLQEIEADGYAAFRHSATTLLGALLRMENATGRPRHPIMHLRLRWLGYRGV